MKDPADNRTIDMLLENYLVEVGAQPLIKSNPAQLESPPDFGKCDRSPSRLRESRCRKRCRSRNEG